MPVAFFILHQTSSSFTHICGDRFSKPKHTNQNHPACLYPPPPILGHSPPEPSHMLQTLVLPDTAQPRMQLSERSHAKLQPPGAGDADTCSDCCHGDERSGRRSACFSGGSGAMEPSPLQQQHQQHTSRGLFFLPCLASFTPSFLLPGNTSQIHCRGLAHL